MSWWEAALLGLIQGLTEFLPVSSSGHLVLGKYLLGIEAAGEAGATFEVFVHFGTVLSILSVYRSEVNTLTFDTLKALRHPTRMAEAYREGTGFRMAVWIGITMIPTALAYLFFRDFLLARFDDPAFVCIMLIVTGVLLLLTTLRKNPDGEINAGKALLVGLAEAAALFPGISRSGSTICAAIYLNTRPDRAANFSFLMLLPVVLGATLLKALEWTGSSGGLGWLPLTIGTLVAYVSGVAAIQMLLGVVRRGKLQYFAYYCFAVGAFGYWLVTTAAGA